MIELDKRGLDLCEFQGRIFELSCLNSNEGSALFVRRFMKSPLSLSLDRCELSFGLDERMGLEDVESHFPSPAKGKKYSPAEMYWIGYMYRYVCYTREMPSRLAYDWFKPELLRKLYYAHHTQSEEYTLSSLMQLIQKDEKLLDKHERLKAAMRRSMCTNCL